MLMNETAKTEGNSKSPPTEGQSDKSGGDSYTLKEPQNNRDHQEGGLKVDRGQQMKNFFIGSCK